MKNIYKATSKARIIFEQLLKNYTGFLTLLLIIAGSFFILQPAVAQNFERSDSENSCSNFDPTDPVGIVPIFKEGNPPESDFDFKIDDPVSGTYDLYGTSLELIFDNVDCGEVFSWEVEEGVEIDSITVKGGPNYLFYDYQAKDGFPFFFDGYLHAPVAPAGTYHDVSHVVFHVGPMPSISIDKDADPKEYYNVGDEITYTFTVTNTGNVTLENVIVDDPEVGIEFGPITLDPGESDVFTHIYTITQENVEDGEFVNIANASGWYEDEKVEDEDEETIYLIQDPAIALDKSAEPGTYENVGDIITYTFEVENTGNVTLTEVEVDDPLFGVTFDAGDMAPGDVSEFTYEYTITQSDLDAGYVYNTATATG